MSRADSPSPAQRGSSRSFLLVVLGVGVVVIVTSGLYLIRPNANDGPLGTDDGDRENPAGGAQTQGGGVGLPGGGRKPRPKSIGDVDDGAGDDDAPEEIFYPTGRGPDGPIFDVTAETVRDMLKQKEWTELRRQLDVLQREGKELPADVVDALLELLKNERWAVDAQLTLGDLKDEGTARKLASLAADPTTPDAVRVHALQALAKSGHGAALDQIRGLAVSADADSAVGRAAMNALAGIGGREGAQALLDVLAAQTEDSPLRDQVLTALAKTKDADATFAERLREARAAGDAEAIERLLRVGSYVRGNAGPELRRELQTIIESPQGLEKLAERPDERDRLRSSAFATAASMGGGALDAVVGQVRAGGEFRELALGALAQARGDDSAAKIVALLRDQTDAGAKERIAKALGETGSRKATESLHALAADADGTVREMAVSGLAVVRDPASVPVLVPMLERSKGDDALAKLCLRALGAIGSKDAKKNLEGLLANEDPFWVEQRLWIKDALRQIEKGP